MAREYSVIIHVIKTAIVAFSKKIAVSCFRNFSIVYSDNLEPSLKQKLTGKNANLPLVR